MKLIDFCCGVGGLSLGMQMAGHEIVAAYDIDPLAVDYYGINIGETASIADLCTLKANDLPAADGFIGGVPCQPFSHSDVNGTGPGDVRNMLPEFRRLVLEARPRLFIFENVPNLLEVHGAYLARELEHFSKAGYWLMPVILDAARFGVPQERRRLIVVGRLDKWPIVPAPTHTRRSAISARQAIAPLLGEPDPDGLPKYLAHLATAPDKLINGSNRSTQSDGSRKIMWRSYDQPSFTVLAGSNYRNKLWASGKAYTLRTAQLAALQSFPSTWRWPEGYNDGKRLVGNAVPPLLAFAIGRAI